MSVNFNTMISLQFTSPSNVGKFALGDKIDLQHWKYKLGHQNFFSFMFQIPYNIQFTRIDWIVTHLKKKQKNTQYVNLCF